MTGDSAPRALRGGVSSGSGVGIETSDEHLRSLLRRPELALLEESCASEQALHAALLDSPRRAVDGARLARLKDADARDNYAMFLRFRDRLLAAGTLEAAYVGLFRAEAIDLPPALIDWLVQAIVQGLLGPAPDGDDSGAARAFEARAGELLHRPQRITVQDGRVLAGDRDTLDMLRDTGGLGELGRLMAQAQTPWRAVDVAVLTEANAEKYLTDSAAGRHTMLLDLSHELQQDVGHGLKFTLKNARSGLPALARVLERWVAQLLGVQVHIEPVPRIEDAQWRWHVGLDAESTALLNDLYEERPVTEERRARLVSLFRLQFANAAEMRADVVGRPVYLGLAHNADGVMRVKPQNLLLNLPLASAC